MTADLTVPAPQLYLGKRIVGQGSGGVYEHVYVPTGAVHGEVPLAGPSEVDAAVRAAVAAGERWRSTKPAKRRDLLMLPARLLDACGKFREFF